MASTYAQIPVQGAAEAAMPVGRARWQRAALGGLIAAVLATAGTAAWLGGRGLKLRHSPLQAAELDVLEYVQAPSKCGKLEPNVEYQFNEAGAWGTNYDHIPTPEMCCAMCQAEPRCKAFTWVKDAGLDGCPSQCWLKGGVGTPVQGKPGLVSGVPPTPPQLPTVPTGRQGAGGSLFCFSLMVPTGFEPKLIQWQYMHSASIFGCDGYQVYSNQNVTIAPGLYPAIVESDLKCQYGGDSQSALNAWIFIAVWNKVTSDGVYRSYDWTVKSDPDCVFFPDRLGAVLAQHQGAAYVNNCRYGMHGPIEVFSRTAIDTLYQDYQRSFDGKAPKTCVERQHFGQWGEDMFMDQCLSKILQVSPRPTDPNLMCEGHCECDDYYWCQHGNRVSYHPFKTVDQYANCMANALTAGGQAAPAASAGAGYAPAPAQVASQAASQAAYGSQAGYATQ